jgi:serine/threonine protein phosphatase 1
LTVSVQFALSVSGKRSLASLPEGVRIYAIGDIHGRLDLLENCLSQIEQDLAQRPCRRPLLIFLGDYIDRGTWSRGTVDRLIDTNISHECIFLKGNHEFVAMRCLTDLTLIPKWLRLGGLETLISYGVVPTISTERRHVIATQMAFQDSLPASHFRFFGQLRNAFSCGDFFFVHAGVRPNIALLDQKEEDLLWIRDEFLSSSEDFGKIVVHGHTPALNVDVRFNRINIDTGAYATGRLTCLILEREQMSIFDTSTE